MNEQTNDWHNATSGENEYAYNTWSIQIDGLIRLLRKEFFEQCGYFKKKSSLEMGHINPVKLNEIENIVSLCVFEV